MISKFAPGLTSFVDTCTSRWKAFIYLILPALWHNTAGRLSQSVSAWVFNRRPTRAPWYPAFRAELLSFPAGKYDDQVDAMGLIGPAADTIGPGRELPPPPKKSE